MSRFEPVSFAFVASGLAIKAKANLCAFTPSRTNPEPSWDGRREDFKQGGLTLPITDIGYWQDRYVLTELTMELPGEKLTLNDVIVSIDRPKEIVTTVLPGLVGSVKEFITAGDYNIRIIVGIVAVRDGKIVDEYPIDGLRAIKPFLETTRHIDVVSRFFELFDIKRMVIKRHSITQDAASNRQVVEIEAVSDVEFEISDVMA